MSCEERSGFLFAHACDRMAVWPCASCGKQICPEHTRLSEAGNVCIGCMRVQLTQQQEQQQGQQAQSQQAQHPAGDDPYFYETDDYSSYDADDYRAFDASSDASDASDEGPERDLGGS